MSLDSEQLTPGVSKNPEERKKKKENCFDGIVIRSLIAINIVLCSFLYQKLIQLLPFRRKHCEINSLPLSLHQFTSDLCGPTHEQVALERFAEN